jgi:hypothetical protein
VGLQLPDRGESKWRHARSELHVLLILLYSSWKGGELVFRHGVGVLDKHSADGKKHMSTWRNLSYLRVATRLLMQTAMAAMTTMAVMMNGNVTCSPNRIADHSKARSG